MATKSNNVLKITTESVIFSFEVHTYEMFQIQMIDRDDYKVSFLNLTRNDLDDIIKFVESESKNHQPNNW